MDVYKEFIQRLRRKEFDKVHILVCDDNIISKKLKNYVQLLKNVKFVDGQYHTFYGDVKTIIASFMIFFNYTVDEIIKIADQYIHDTDKNEILMSMERTIAIHKANQVEFGNDFLPVTTAIEKQTYEEIEKEYHEYMKKLDELKNYIVIKLDKKNKVDDFAKEHFGIAVTQTSEMFNMVYVYLGMMCADSIHQTRVSLEEILLRMSKNLARIQGECDDNINTLMHQLYDKNKESMSFTRMLRKNSKDLAEVNRGIQTIRVKIEEFQATFPTTRIDIEVEYWTKRVEEFREIADNLVKLKAEQDNVIRSEKMYNSLKCTELPGSKLDCWNAIGETLTQRKEFLTEKIIEESKALITFFAVRGTDRILYTDNIGPYYVDEFNHQVYVFEYALGIYHIDCQGAFQKFPENAYYFDQFGRYFINDAGKKVYQTAVCTSQYDLRDNVLHKVSKDCGHSENYNKKCKMEISDPTDVEILPDFDPIDISGTLDKETVKYLWDCFGSLLPEALYDVGTTRPRNPIHFLAHKLLYHKYRRTKSELVQKKKEAEQYRADIFKDRKEKAAAASRAWKSKQVKRRKPEESDDTEPRAAYDAHIAEQMFIHALNYLND